MHPDPIRSPQFYTSVPSKRFVAWLVDGALTVALTVIAVPFTAFTGLFFFPLLWMVISFAYRVLSIAAGSATPGMRLMSIELRDRRGERLDFSQAFAHTLGYSVSFAVPLIQVISVVMMAGSERGQGVTDLVLGTVMINRR